MNPPPPPAPDDATRQRWLTQELVFSLLIEDYGPNPNDAIQAWMEQHLGAAALMVGPPDVSANTLVTACQQFSTPGLYGLSEPLISRLSDSEGLPAWMSAAGYWTKMQAVQRYTFGVGNWALALDVQAGRLLVRHVPVFRVYTRTDPLDSTTLLELRELRQAKNPKGEIGWYWWCYRIDETPAYTILDEDGKPCSNYHLSMGGGQWAPPEGLVGDEYPYRYEDGTPFIPYAFYGNSDSGSFWDLSGRRGARVGALNSITLSTFNLRAAFGAAVPPVFAVDIQKPAGNQRGIQQNTQLGDAGVSDSIPVAPGSMLFLASMQDGKNPQIVIPQMGGNLQALQQYTSGYMASQLANQGLSSDQLVTSNPSNPASAGAIALTSAAKRQIAAQVAPYFRRCDLAAIRMVAALARIGGVARWPETGWSLSYAQIPLSPQEQQAIREEEDHDYQMGMVSKVDLWLKRHPGQSRDEAVAHLRRVQLEEAMLAAPAATPVQPETEEETAEEPASEAAESSESSSEEVEAEKLLNVAEELNEMEKMLPADAEAADIDVPALRAAIENIREELEL